VVAECDRRRQHRNSEADRRALSQHVLLELRTKDAIGRRNLLAITVQ
jgi:hypothetical protein